MDKSDLAVDFYSNENYGRNAVLLGGSNSVLMNSIRLGLSEVYSVNNYALGATSCMQNLTELLKNYDVIENADVVFTESNVNDIMTYVGLGISKARMKFIIDEYYRSLYNVNKPVYVLILPTHPRQENDNDILYINELHKMNCVKFGFKYVCFDSIMTVLNKEQTDLLLPHPRHFNEAFIYHMTSNLAKLSKAEYQPSLREVMKDRYFKLVGKKNYPYVDGAEYLFMPASELIGDFTRTEKNNSLFSVKLIDLYGEAKFHSRYFNYEIVAVNVWCDDYSSMYISNGKRTVVKTFIRHYTTTELKEPIEIGNELVVGINNSNIKVTEATLLAKYESSKGVNELKIEGFTLMRAKNISSEFKMPLSKKEIASLDISDKVFPNWKPYAAAAKTYSIYNGAVGQSI